MWGREGESRSKPHPILTRVWIFPRVTWTHVRSAILLKSRISRYLFCADNINCQWIPWSAILSEASVIAFCAKTQLLIFLNDHFSYIGKYI